VQSVIADISGDFFCRFCTAKSCDTRSDCVASGAFSLRTKEVYAAHLKTALENNANCFWSHWFSP